MRIRVTPRAAVYIIWQRTRYTKGFILYRIAYRLNTQFPYFAYPFYYLLGLLKRSYIERLFNEDMQIDFDSIVNHLPKELSRSLDIGAGVGGINVLLSAHYNHQPEIHLLDKSEVDKSIYYGFKEKTAFYNSLSEASRLLTDSGVPKEHVILHEVGDKKNSPFAGIKYDLITSFISWGYHYPINTYLEEVKRSLSPGGVLIVDLRAEGDEFQVLQREFTEVKVIYETPYLQRVIAKNIS